VLMLACHILSLSGQHNGTHSVNSFNQKGKKAWYSILILEKKTYRRGHEVDVSPRKKHIPKSASVAWRSRSSASPLLAATGSSEHHLCIIALEARQPIANIPLRHFTTTQPTTVFSASPPRAVASYTTSERALP
jgi:hypothetical protein